MNHLINAKVFASGALHEINEHGIGRGSWLKHQITNARIEVMRVSDREHDTVPCHLQNDHIILELFAAAKAIADRDVAAAEKSLKLVMESLDLLIEDRTKASIDRLIESVYPWRNQ